MQPIEFNKDIGEMNEAETRATLRELHSNYSDARDKFTQLQEEKESLEEDIEEFKEEAETSREFFAGFAAQKSGLDKETILEKFDTSDEIKEEFLGDAEFYLEGGEADDPDEENEFDEKEEKSDNLPGDGGSEWYETEAEKTISQITVQHDQI